ncbi:unannotated protein [freshwater metagenome]|uniref:Unannotated protein n=1 Tax=freshwater metagenome TaxID=449393 RepID=A0A6J7J5F9_9ZZZZ
MSSGRACGIITRCHIEPPSRPYEFDPAPIAMKIAIHAPQAALNGIESVTSGPMPASTAKISTDSS